MRREHRPNSKEAVFLEILTAISSLTAVWSFLSGKFLVTFLSLVVIYLCQKDLPGGRNPDDRDPNPDITYF